MDRLAVECRSNEGQVARRHGAAVRVMKSQAGESRVSLTQGDGTRKEALRGGVGEDHAPFSVGHQDRLGRVGDSGLHERAYVWRPMLWLSHGLPLGRGPLLCAKRSLRDGADGRQSCV